MKTQIRRSVFESNSSSSHSLTWQGKPLDFNTQQVETDEDNNVVITLDEYGWEYGIHKGVNSKLSYLASMLYYVNDTVTSDLTEVEVGGLLEFRPLYDWAKEKGFNGLAIKGDGYVDHQSCYGTVEEFLSMYNLTSIDAFLTNNMITIETGNDNDCGYYE
ncbi:MAG: hypothetical protein ACRCRT_00500 [Cetobacterium somerae]